MRQTRPPHPEDATPAEMGGAGSPPPWRGAAVAALLAALIVGVFLPLRHADFLNYDDPYHVLENDHVRGGLSLGGVWWAFTSAELNWQPLTWLSHMLDCQVFGLAPAGHHLTSVALHTVNALLLLFALQRLTGAFWPPVLVAALFGLHPLHVEPVAWISARPHLISGLLWMAALLAYARYAERPTLPRYLAVCAWMLLDLLNRGLTATLPLVFLLLDDWPLGRWRPGEGARSGRGAAAPDLVREKIPLFAISLAGAVVQYVSRVMNGSLAAADPVALPVRVANALANGAAYLWKTLWPFPLALPYPAQTQLPPASLLLAALFVLAGGGAALAMWGRRRRYLRTGALWYVATLLPVIGLLPTGRPAMADRHTYLPLIGLFVAAAWTLDEAVRRNAARRLPAVAAAACALLLCAAGTRHQLDYWRDSIALFSHAAAVAGGSDVAEINLGDALFARGERDAAKARFEAALRLNPREGIAHANLGHLLLDEGNLPEAQEHLEAALSVRPEFVPAAIALARVRIRQGDLDGARAVVGADAEPPVALAHFRFGQALAAEDRLPEATAEFESAMRLEPDLAGVRFHLGLALEAAGEREKAVAQYREELQRHPGNSEAENNLGVLLNAMGLREEARVHFALALRDDPNNAQAHSNLAVLLIDAGELDAAERHLADALRLRPDYFDAHMNLGLLRLRREDLPGAADAFRRATAIRPEFATAHYSLAQVLEGAGQAEQAAAEYRRTLELDPDHPRAGQRLESLESRTAPRSP